MTHEQRELLCRVAAGRHKWAKPELSDLQLLKRAGLIVEDGAARRFCVTEAGKRYVAFIERVRPSAGFQPRIPELVGAAQTPREAGAP